MAGWHVQISLVLHGLGLWHIFMRAAVQTIQTERSDSSRQFHATGWWIWWREWDSPCPSPPFPLPSHTLPTTLDRTGDLPLPTIYFFSLPHPPAFLPPHHIPTTSLMPIPTSPACPYHRSIPCLLSPCLPSTYPATTTHIPATCLPTLCLLYPPPDPDPEKDNRIRVSKPPQSLLNP